MIPSNPKSILIPRACQNVILTNAGIAGTRHAFHNHMIGNASNTDKRRINPITTNHAINVSNSFIIIFNFKLQS